MQWRYREPMNAAAIDVLHGDGWRIQHNLPCSTVPRRWRNLPGVDE